jgi:hypothetical protein
LKKGWQDVKKRQGLSTAHHMADKIKPVMFDTINKAGLTHWFREQNTKKRQNYYK